MAGELVQSFEEAKVLAEETEAVSSYKDHQNKVLIPYFGNKYSKVLQGCFKSVKVPDDSKFDLVIALGSTGSVEKVYRDRETNIGLCVIKELEKDKFPSPIMSPFYVHIAMSFTE
jgi:hypothetical protein